MNKAILTLSILATSCNTPSSGLAASNQQCDQNLPATAPIERFKINADGTVIDTYTGLMWKRCLEGAENCEATNNTFPSSFSWGEALARARDSNFAGYNNWRLPNIKELTSILELKCYDPAINLSVFPNPEINFIWSSSVDDILDRRSWGVFFRTGFTSNEKTVEEIKAPCFSCYSSWKTKYGHVLLVRG